MASVQALLHHQEAGLARAIDAARHQHRSGLAEQLSHRLHDDKDLTGWMHSWLTRKTTVYTKRGRRQSEAWVDSVIADAIHDAGLPVIPFDRGNVLPPGLSLSMNATGRPEPLVPYSRPAPSPQPVRVELAFKGGHSNYGNFLLNEIQRLVDVKGAGDVSVAFGNDH